MIGISGVCISARMLITQTRVHIILLCLLIKFFNTGNTPTFNHPPTPCYTIYASEKAILNDARN
jgi:hypothetical protein